MKTVLIFLISLLYLPKNFLPFYDILFVLVLVFEISIRIPKSYWPLPFQRPQDGACFFNCVGGFFENDRIIYSHLL